MNTTRALTNYVDSRACYMTKGGSFWRIRNNPENRVVEIIKKSQV